MSDNLPKSVGGNKLAQWYKSGQVKQREYALAREILKVGVQGGRRLSEVQWKDITKVYAGVNFDAVWPIVAKTLSQHGLLKAAQWEGGPDEDVDAFFTDDEVLGDVGPTDLPDPGIMPSDAPFDPGGLDDVGVENGVIKAPPSFDAEDVERALAKIRRRRASVDKEAHKVWNIASGPEGAQLERKIDEQADRERTDPGMLGRTASTYIGGVEFTGKVTKVASDGSLELTAEDGNVIADVAPEFCDFFR